MKVYIAGKITGNKQYKEQFAQAQKQLEQEGHIVLNPAVLPEGMKPADYMRICLSMIECSDIVAMLPNHLESTGASIEMNLADYTGKKIRFL